MYLDLYEEIADIDFFHLFMSYFAQKTFREIATQTDPYIIRNYIKV